jgi:hypothetical protein
LSATVVRPDHEAPRCFPAVSVLGADPQPPEPSDPTPEQKTARGILALGTRKLSLPQRHGWRCIGTTPVARLLRWHREALRAELGGRPRRAAVFWQEVHGALARLPELHPAWSQLCTEHGQPAGDGPLWRRRLVREVLFETHLALCNGYTQQTASPQAAAQADRHVLWLERLLPAAEYTPTEQRRFLEALVPGRLEYHLQRQQFAEARRLAWQLIALAPDYAPHQDRLIDVEMRAGMAEVNTTGDSAALRQRADKVGGSIKRLQRLGTRWPYNLACFGGLATLYMARASMLARANVPSEALVDVARARSHQPDLAEIDGTEAQVQGTLDALRIMMSVAQSQVGAVHYQGRYRVTTVLSAQGAAVAAEVQRGTTLRDAYLASAEPEAVKQAREKAYHRELWLRLGLAQPQGATDQQWEERAAGLAWGVKQLQQQPARNPVALAAAWQTLVRGNPKLKLDQIEREPLFRYCLSLPTAPAPVAPTGPRPRKVGDRVLGQWSDRFWYTGRVQDIKDGRLAIAFDDGDHARLAPEQVRAIDLAPGDLVQGRWKQGRVFYPGRITHREGDRVHIQYDDGDQEWTEIRWLRVQRNPAGAQPVAAAAQAAPLPAVQAPAPLTAAPGTTPVLTCKAPAAGDRGPFDLWLLSRRDALLKTVLAAAVVLAAVFAWQTLRRDAVYRERQSAYQEAVAAAARHDEQAALDAAARFFAVAPAANDPRYQHVQEIQQAVPEWAKQTQRDQAYAQLLAAFKDRDKEAVLRAVAAFQSALPANTDEPRTAHVKELAAQAEALPALRQRDQAYAQLQKAFAGGDEQGVATAAKAFLDALPPQTDDPRTAQVKELAAQAEEWPNLRERDKAHAALLAAVERGDAPAVFKAAEHFLAFPPVHGSDARTAQVLAAYHREFHVWYLAQARATLRRSDCVSRYLALTGAAQN